MNNINLKKEIINQYLRFKHYLQYYASFTIKNNSACDLLNFLDSLSDSGDDDNLLMLNHIITNFDFEEFKRNNT